MSKWRPTDLDCLYVIPDVHGMYDQLQLILRRILPLRKSDGGKDRLVMLGDYIDRRTESHKVLDLLIEVQQKYKDQVIFLSGNHEIMLLEGIEPGLDSHKYRFWMNNGGEATLRGYIQRAQEDIDNPFTLMRPRIPYFIPNEHIKFMQNLRPFWEFENWIFVHAGCDPYSPLDKQDKRVLTFDRTLFEVIGERFEDKPLPWEKVIVTGHNGMRGFDPYVRDKYMMLDTSYEDFLLVVELRSMQAFAAKKGKKRLIQYNLRD
jgi:serine/threonine protein phosphatase 1